MRKAPLTDQGWWFNKWPKLGGGGGKKEMGGG